MRDMRKSRREIEAKVKELEELAEMDVNEIRIRLLKCEECETSFGVPSGEANYCPTCGHDEHSSHTEVFDID